MIGLVRTDGFIHALRGFERRTSWPGSTVLANFLGNGGGILANGSSYIRWWHKRIISEFYLYFELTGFVCRTNFQSLASTLELTFTFHQTIKKKKSP